MAEGPSAAEAAPLHRGLPEEITVWEILVRLPPKSLLRCRAVCPAWRRATSTRDFLLAHHARQPSVPLLRAYHLTYKGVSLDVIPFDHRAGLATVDQLQSVARLGYSFFGLDASCDGLLVLNGRYRNLGYSICNPATRQHARLEELDHFAFLGMYPHGSTGEYRLLLGKSTHGTLAPDVFYIFTLGSGQPPRRISCSNVVDMSYESSSILCHGSLHWLLEQHEGASNMIKVFNTTTESFRQMRAPAVLGKVNLFEMDGMLGMSSCNDAAATIDIWMTQDYESEAWAFKYRVELPVAELTEQFGKFHFQESVVVPSWDGKLLVMVKIEDWLHQVDINGKLVASFHRRSLGPTQLRLKQTLVPHAFFPTLEGYVVNDSPFI
uniref:Uncharacterized protein n=1 Tax=Avena sativa TaxID=4498 RepID=A0ACD5WLE9_AVESA